MLSTKTPQDGRFIAAALVIGYFLFLGAAILLSGASRSEVWKELGVPAMDPGFGDLQNVVAGIQNQDAGRALGDPNPFDPWGRPYIYPSIWLQIKALGFNSQTVVGFGLFFIFLFFVSAFALLGKLNRYEGIFTGLFLISPALMTGIERCNIDLILFPLILAALALRRWPPAAAALLLFVTALKLHPVGAFIAFLAPPWRRTLPWLAGMVGVLLIYLFVDRQELAVIGAHAQHYPAYTFGSAVFGFWYAQAYPASGPADASVLFFWGSFFLLLIGVCALRFSPVVPPEPRWEREIYSFRLGAGLYLALFALGSNNDYAMMFFLFCLPLLFRLWHVGNPLQWWAIVALSCSIIYVNWDLFSDEYLLRHVLFKQALSWSLVGSILGLLCATRAWPALSEAQ